MGRPYLAERPAFIHDMTSQAVPVWHVDQEHFRWKGCRDCLALSLQPHLNRNGNVNRGQLLIRCSSCFRRNHDIQCRYSHPFAMALFSRLPTGLFKTNTRGRTLDNSWRQQEPKKIHCLPRKCFSLCLKRITKVKSRCLTCHTCQEEPTRQTSICSTSSSQVRTVCVGPNPTPE